MATQTMNLKLRTIKLCKYGTSNKYANQEHEARFPLNIWK